MMNSMRFNVLIATLSLTLFVLSTGCSKETSKSSDKQQTEDPSTAKGGDESSEKDQPVSSDIVSQKWTGDLDGMVKRRFIRVLTTYSKTSYFVDLAEQHGLVYDSFHLFDNDLNTELKTKNVRVQVVFVPVANDDLIPALLEGRGDIIAAGKLITEWRREKVDFTEPTRTNVSSLVVTNSSVPPISTVQDLGGKEVYLHMADVSKEAIDQFNAMLAKAGKPPVKVRPAPEELAEEDILEMVNAGIVQATIVNDYIGEFWQQIFPNIVLNRNAAVRSNGKLAMMVRKNSPQLLAELNSFIARYPEGSKERNILLQKYLKNVKYAKAATSKSEREKFENIVQYMRKYSDKYNLDFLLVGAQGYQESGLDQNRKSPVGAIGVMQLMPATGKDMKVGDITKLEPNIHAGVKYIRFMMDQYYADEPMDRLNKGLFTFASYNAGPSRVRQLRDLAAKRGLNPNVWFNNVEIIAAEKIGRETVQYVSNIYKYYLAYKMLMEQREERIKAKSQAIAKK